MAASAIDETPKDAERVAGRFAAWKWLTAPIVCFGVSLGSAFAYFMLVTPLGLALKALGKDPMNRRIDKRAKSYWVARRGARPKASYFRQF